ncbi:biotin carboxylase N-terminal domain-containing protein [Algiphilus sp. W345]|uniref:Biotin carboxylase N-terminal domain-containing protein n=1 Tax=Banduia mediterranea TaxID=3075609 RepID=A0ABU2WFK3_9GAMM|nr:biotin carboxylase N-terminal domain-containing protein [Algiphilus sp. W345]MDT0496394.1 biotin carboxylase N-terminal domain-containing protein [Algiphilus sp. W345]
MAFSTVLIANRGEIACRIARSARRLGCRTVAVYSEADRGALHVEAADLAVCIGAAAPVASYLKIEALIDAARRSGADAIHPGYGFLSENAAFARACAAAGLVFIGPTPEAIEAMGNKRAARRRVAAAGVPCVPGHDEGSQDDAVLIEAGMRIGFPLMVKAAAGGGGRGMRRVLRAEDLPAALASARGEAQSAFGNGELILERAVEGARHVELQVFGDTHGHVIHLGERDCSAQRRNQKVIEESPSPAVDGALRARMGEMAVAAARAVGYVGAGTVEMLLGQDGAFYFLEMNTRLQVEHPVTEAVTGLDLVEWQLRVAAGEPLPLRQEQVQLSGHAIEVRLYAEDPDAGYAPQTGRVLCWRAPDAALARTDAGIGEGRVVGADYDPMLAKLIAHGTTREEARRKLLLALEQTVLLGLKTNRAQLIDLLADPVFRDGAVTTRWLDTRSAGTAGEGGIGCLTAAAVAVIASGAANAGGWRSTGVLAWPVRLQVSGAAQLIAFTVSQDVEGFTVRSGDAAGTIRLRPITLDAPNYVFETDGLRHRFHIAQSAEGLWYAQCGAHLGVYELPRALAASAGQGGDSTLAPMSGRVAEIFVAAGDAVEKGALLLTLEAMKMFHEIRAGRAGRVAELVVAVGEQVSPRQKLVMLEAAEPVT